jgi:enamine deaminase RidA (YjgF/YER057c/UK114 family)
MLACAFQSILPQLRRRHAFLENPLVGHIGSDVKQKSVLSSQHKHSIRLTLSDTKLLMHPNFLVLRRVLRTQLHRISNMITRQHTSNRMSKIVKHNGTIYLCGQVGAGDSVAEQTRDCLSRVDTLLRDAGSDREHILQAIVWLSDMRYFAEMNEVWDDWMPNGHAPARACGEAKLARDVLHVEIIVTAAEK